jgi:hypothetical protein
MKIIALFFAVIALGMLAGSFLAIPKAKWGQVALLFIAAILMGGAAAAINAAA